MHTASLLNLVQSSPAQKYSKLDELPCNNQFFAETETTSIQTTALTTATYISRRKYRWKLNSGKAPKRKEALSVHDR